jgi:hypothetical protein
MSQEVVHSGGGHKMRFTQRQWRLYDTTQGVQYPNSIGAPSAANFWRARHAGDGFHELRVTDGEILHSMVKVAVGRISRGHAATCTMAFFEHTDPVTCLHQSAGESDTGHAGANDSCMFHIPTLHPCGSLRTHGLSQ